MHMSYRTFFIVLFAAFSAPVQADDLVSQVVQNFPYEEVDKSYGAATIQNGRCREGTPFSISEKRFLASTETELAKLIHEKTRGLGANAFVITDLREDTRVRSVMVTPLTCALR